MNEDFERRLAEEYAKVKQNLKKPNILIAGGTGVGKSSIINMVFGKNVAQTGTGKPITQGIEVYESENVDVRIYDSMGYEIQSSRSDEFLQSVIALAKNFTTPERAIHLVWYCISAAGGRVTDYDLKAIKTFSDCNIPTAIVFTKVDQSNDEEIDKMKSAIGFRNNFFETTTHLPQYNQINELIEWSVNCLPDSLRFAFIKSQKANLEAKKKEANSYIKQHCVAAFGVGFSPIPMSDAPILVANELALIARLLHLYDLGSLTETIKSIGIGTIIGNLASLLGKSVVASLLKFIPGIGTAIGGCINASVGALITAAIGKATSVTAHKICNATLNGEESKAQELLKNFGPIMMESATNYIKSGKKKEEIINE